jgi:hypothetical protein
MAICAQVSRAPLPRTSPSKSAELDYDRSFESGESDMLSSHLLSALLQG